MTIEPPLPLEDYASLAAEMDAGFPKEEALERAKLDDDRWLAAQTYWLKRMGDEAERQRFETTTRYRTLFNAKRAIFAAKWKNRHKKAKPVAPDATPLRHVEELLGMVTVLEPNLSYGLPPPVAIPPAVRPIVVAPAPPMVGAPIPKPDDAPRAPMPPARFVPAATPAPASERAPDTAPMPPPTMERPAPVEPPAHVFIPHAAPQKPSSVVATAPPPAPVASTMPAPPAAAPQAPGLIDAAALRQALGTAAVGGRTMSVDIQQLLAAATPFMKKLGDESSTVTPAPATAPAPPPKAPVAAAPTPAPAPPASAGPVGSDGRPLPLSHRDHPLNRTSPSSADFASAVRAATPFKSTPKAEVGAPLPAPPPPPPLVPATPLPPRPPAYPPFGGPAPKPTAVLDDDGGPRTQVVPEASSGAPNNQAPPEPWRTPAKKENPLAQTMFADFQTSGGTALPFGSEKAEAKPNRALPSPSPSNPGQGTPPPRDPGAAQPPVAKRFTINQFASLTAEIAENPSNIAAVRAKYGLSEAQHREESERWTSEFEKNAEIKQRYFGIVHRYREYLRKRPT